MISVAIYQFLIGSTLIMFDIELWLVSVLAHVSCLCSCKKVDISEVVIPYIKRMKELCMLLQAIFLYCI